jgi:hypothetical protein
MMEIWPIFWMPRLEEAVLISIYLREQFS